MDNVTLKDPELGTVVLQEVDSVDKKIGQLQKKKVETIQKATAKSEKRAGKDSKGIMQTIRSLFNF